MTVKRYTPTQCCEHDGTYVAYSDYQKLVAENAALKHAIIETQGGIELASAAINDDKRGDTFRDILNAIYMKTSAETPATDAAITEIKAHDINLLIDKLSGLTFTIGVSCGYVKEFAANLRAGSKE